MVAPIGEVRAASIDATGTRYDAFKKVNSSAASWWKTLPYKSIR